MIYVHSLWIILLVKFVGGKNCIGRLGFPCPYDALPDPGCFDKEKFPVRRAMGSDVKPIDNWKYPYIVSLQKVKCGNHNLANACYDHFCGGTMIAPNLILTAAHCFDDLRSQNIETLNGQYYYRPTQPIFAAVSSQCRHLSNNTYGRFQVYRIFIHPNYSSDPIPVNDVAIVEIFANNGQFYNGRVVEIVTEVTTEDTSFAQVIGYGQFHQDDVGKYIVHTLHGALLEAINEQICKFFYKSDKLSSSLLNYTNMMCYFNRKADACEGDSGGPLLIKNKDIQIGLVSWAPGGNCKTFDQRQYPGVYVRLSLFTSWIQQQIQDHFEGDRLVTVSPLLPPPPQISSETANTEVEQQQLCKNVESAEMKNNDFYFDIKGLSDFNFDVKDYSISSCQPWGGVSTKGCSHSECGIRVKAGRKGTTSVADWFYNKIQPGSTIGCDTDAEKPSKLNFAVGGQLSFKYMGKTYVGNDIFLGQGHNSNDRNNWWIGGPNMNKESPDWGLGMLFGNVKAVGQFFQIQGTQDTVKVLFEVQPGDVYRVSMEVL